MGEGAHSTRACYIIFLLLTRYNVSPAILLSQYHPDSGLYKYDTRSPPCKPLENFTSLGGGMRVRCGRDVSGKSSTGIGPTTFPLDVASETLILVMGNVG